LTCYFVLIYLISYLNRWTQPDTIIPDLYNPQNLNRFTYVTNNPILYNDPSGHCEIVCAVVLIVAALVALTAGPQVIEMGTPKIVAATQDPVAFSAQLKLSQAYLAGHSCGRSLASNCYSGSVGFRPKTPLVDLYHEGINEVVGGTLETVSGFTTVAGAPGILGLGSSLPDTALVCRGGICQASNFANGTGVVVEEDGTLSGVSVSSASGKSVQDLTSVYPNKQVGVTTVGQVRSVGGDIYSSPITGNPYHATIDGLTASQLEELFTPTIQNPNILQKIPTPQ
jgi:hypothetical protein